MKILLPLTWVGKSLLISTLCLLGVLALAIAQSNQSSLSGYLPFEFQVDKKVFPADTYKFLMTRQPGGFPTLTITGKSGTTGSFHVVTKLGGGFDFGDARLVFDNADSKRYLSEVWLNGQDGYLLPSISKEHTHQTFLITGSGASAKMSGKKVYEQTCQRCHGPNGQGNPDADKFFKVAIPKLNSAAIQARSDADLKTVITQGSGNMAPVRMAEARVQHLLPPDSVDAVITFLRTLK